MNALFFRTNAREPEKTAHKTKINIVGTVETIMLLLVLFISKSLLKVL